MRLLARLAGWDIDSVARRLSQVIARARGAPERTFDSRLNSRARERIHPCCLFFRDSELRCTCQSFNGEFGNPVLIWLFDVGNFLFFLAKIILKFKGIGYWLASFSIHFRKIQMCCIVSVSWGKNVRAIINWKIIMYGRKQDLKIEIELKSYESSIIFDKFF